MNKRLRTKVRIQWNKGYAYGYWSVVQAGKWHWTTSAERAQIRAFRRRINELNIRLNKRYWK